jgi:RecA/RadA recombinase
MASALKDPQAELAKILAGAERKYGKGSIHKADESVPFNRLPFVEHNLNYATEGGPAFGRFMALAGEPGSGKTRIALELIAQAQQLPLSAEVILIPRIVYHSSHSDDYSLSDAHRTRHMTMATQLSEQLDWIRNNFPNGADAVYYNAEQQFDPLWAKKIGIDLKRLTIFESTTIEEIVEMMQNLYEHVPLHIVDSTSSGSSLLSQKHDVGKSLMGVDARQWKVCLKDSMPSFDPQRNMGIMIHQLSTNMKTGGLQSQSTQYMRFISRLTLMFRHGQFLWNKDGVLREDKPAGIDEQAMAGIAEADGRIVLAKVDKSTVCRGFRTAALQWHYRKAKFLPIHELASAGLYFGFIIQKKSWFSVPGEINSIGQGLKAVYARLAEDEELRDRIVCRLLDYTDEGLDG